MSNRNAVYKIFFKNCDAIHVGKMKRQLKMRIKEHKNVRLDQSKHSIITELH